MTYTPKNYHEALGALDAERMLREDADKRTDDLREKFCEKAKALEEQGWRCKRDGCEDWAQYLRAAMEIWLVLGVTSAWLAIGRELPHGCPGCGHQRETNEYEICEDCYEAKLL